MTNDHSPRNKRKLSKGQITVLKGARDEVNMGEFLKTGEMNRDFLTLCFAGLIESGGKLSSSGSEALKTGVYFAANATEPDDLDWRHRHS